MNSLVKTVLLTLMVLPLWGGDVDPKAAEIVDRTETAMGGREAYDATRYLTWKFFGRRFHVWDKYTGDIRVEDGKGLVVIMNLNTREGRAWLDGQAVTDPAALKEHLTWGYEAWVNDSYWLVMPYKLRDPGVTLKYLGEGMTEAGDAADVLELTFANVGVTPENKYEVLVAKDSGLVREWKFFEHYTDPDPRFVRPWDNWKRYGHIYLSDQRGKGAHTDVAVFDQLPMPAFDGPEPIQLNPNKP